MGLQRCQSVSVYLLGSSSRPRSLVYEKYIVFSLVSSYLCSVQCLWPGRVYLSGRKSVKKVSEKSQEMLAVSDPNQAKEKASKGALCLKT